MIVVKQLFIYTHQMIKKQKMKFAHYLFKFLIRDNKLNMITTMRSNDIYLGFTYDVFIFTLMQEILANELGMLN